MHTEATIVFFGRIKCILSSDRSSVWLEHLIWDQGVAGSNPVGPTNILPGYPIVGMDRILIPERWSDSTRWH